MLLNASMMSRTELMDNMDVNTEWGEHLERQENMVACNAAYARLGAPALVCSCAGVLTSVTLHCGVSLLSLFSRFLVVFGGETRKESGALFCCVGVPAAALRHSSWWVVHTLLVCTLVRRLVKVGLVYVVAPAVCSCRSRENDVAKELVSVSPAAFGCDRGRLGGGRGYVSFTRTSVSPLCWERHRCLIRRRIVSELHGLSFTPVATDWGYRNGSVALDVVVPLRMLDHLGWGCWANDIDTVAPEEQLVVKRMEKDGGGVELPREQVLKRSHPAQHDVSLSGGKETLPQVDYCLLHGATLDVVHSDPVCQLHGKLLAQDGVGGAAYFNALSEAGNGILLGRVGEFGHDDAGGMHGRDHGHSPNHPLCLCCVTGRRGLRP